MNFVKHLNVKDYKNKLCLKTEKNYYKHRIKFLKLNIEKYLINIIKTKDQ